MRIRESRFGRLTGHFFGGFLENDLLMSAEAGMQNALSQALALIIAPGLFYSLLACLWKYGSMPDATRQMLAWEDRLFFTGIAMAMTGLLAVIEWDALFPDRRDYQILAPLPIPSHMLISAKLCAVLLLLTVFWAAGSLAPGFLFTAAVLAPDEAWAAFPLHFAAHVAVTFAASAFVFLSCAGLQGLLMNLLPPRWFRRISAYVQMALVVMLVLAFLGLVPVVANSIRWIRAGHEWLGYLPPFWFLGLYQEMIGRGSTFFSWQASIALKAMGAAAAVSALAWAASYRRHLARSLECLEPRGEGPGWRRRTSEALLHFFVLRHPQERACFHFAAVTLARSGLHRLLLAGYCGIGFAVAACLAASLFARPARPAPFQLSVQLILPFFLMAGIRMAYALPAELRANWAFQAAEPGEAARCDAGFRKAMLAFGAAPLFVLLPVHVFLWGRAVAVAHLLFGILLAAILTEILLLGFDKIPFTCTYLPGRANVKKLWPIYLGAFWGYAFAMAELESALLARPAGFALFCVAAAGMACGLRRLRRRRLRKPFRFQFEELPEPAVRVLGIGPGLARRGEESPAPAAAVEFRPAPQPVWTGGPRPPRRPEWAHMVRDLRADLRHGLRNLARSPGFTVTAVGILGLAIAVDTTLFTYFSAVVLKPLPLDAPQRNVELEGIDASLRPHRFWSYPDFVQMRARNSAFDEMYGWAEAQVTVREPAPRTWKAVLVTGNFFRVFNAGMTAGRAFGEDEAEAPGRNPVVVISHRLWQAAFQGDRGIAGRVIRIRQTHFTITGVAGPAFTGTDPLTVPDAWFPVTMRDELLAQSRLSDPEDAFLNVAGLLKTGLTPAQARDRLFPAVAGLNGQHPQRAIQRITLEPREKYVTPKGPALAAIVCTFSLAGLLLLIACANLAGILLARGAARQREMAIRASIGASRGRLVRQLLAESVLLAAFAGSAALLLTQAAADVLQRYLYTLLIRQGYTIQEVSPDWRVFVFTAAVALAAGLVLGLAPALEGTRGDLAGRLKDAGCAGTPRGQASRLREMLVVGQVAASLVLLVVAGLCVRSSQRIQSLDAGFDTTHAIDVRADGAKTRLIARLRADSRFTAVSEAFRTPLTGWPKFLPGKVNGKIWMLGYNYVERDYFDVLNIPVRHGRLFTAAEARAGAPFAIVSDVTARLLWPGQDPLGKIVEVAPPRAGERFTAGKYEVIGVVPNVINGVLYLGKDYTSIYLPAPPGDPRNASLILRSLDTSQRTLADIRNLCAETEGVHGCEPVPMREIVWQQRFPHAAAGSVTTALGTLALLMTCIGLWGLVAYTVARRTREIGIRMALGATPRSVLRSILKQGGLRVGLGILLGVPCAVMLSRLMTRMLAPGAIQAFDPATYLLVPVSLAAVALAAAWIPARRATRVDPIRALRQE
jgi:predicted permease